MLPHTAKRENTLPVTKSIIMTLNSPHRSKKGSGKVPAWPHIYLVCRTLWNVMTLQRLLHFAKGGYFPSLDIFQNNCLLLRRLRVFPLTAANCNLTAVQAGLGTRCTDKPLLQSYQSFFCLESCTVCQSCCSALFNRRIDPNIDDIDPSVAIGVRSMQVELPPFH